MDSLEAKAVCFGAILRSNPTTWAKQEADAAGKVADSLLDAKKINLDVYKEVVREVTGNHSQNRQRFQSGGFIERKETDSALFRKIREYITKMDAEMPGNDEKKK